MPVAFSSEAETSGKNMRVPWSLWQGGRTGAKGLVNGAVDSDIYGFDCSDGKIH